MKLFGPTAELTEIAKLIMTENIEALEKEVSKGFDINLNIQITEHIAETPIVLALCENKKKVLNWLLSKNVELNGKDNLKFIEFCSLLDVREVNWMKHKFLDLLSDVDNYGVEGFLVWYPKKKCLAFADYEHKEFKELCSVEEFLNNPSKQIDKIFE